MGNCASFRGINDISSNHCGTLAFQSAVAGVLNERIKHYLIHKLFRHVDVQFTVANFQQA